MLNFTVDPRIESVYNGFLHTTVFIVLLLDLFTFYLIFAKTPKHSHSYRWHVLHMQFWTTLFDLHVSVLFMPMPLFPLIGGYCSGLLCRAGLPMHYSHVIAFAIDLAIYISFGMSIFYRHQLILPHGHWLRIGKGARSLLFAFVGLTMQLPVITGAVAKVDSKTAEEYLRVNHPAMLWLVAKPNWIVYEPSAFPVPWMGAELAAIILIYPPSFLFITFHLYFGISRANFMSMKTRNLHKHIVTVLLIQVCTFSTCLFIPVPVIMYSAFTESVSHGKLKLLFSFSEWNSLTNRVNLLFVSMIMLDSWSHSLILIATTPSYRAVFTGRFRAPKRSIEPFTSRK